VFWAEQKRSIAHLMRSVVLHWLKRDSVDILLEKSDMIAQFEEIHRRDDRFRCYRRPLFSAKSFDFIYASHCRRERPVSRPSSESCFFRDMAVKANRYRIGTKID
jgi:hypothetical protein